MTAGAHPRSALEFFNGTWTIGGHEAGFREVCRWLPGGGFVACHSEDPADAPPSFAMSVFGYAEADGVYTYSGFNGTGTQRTLRGTLQDGVWRFFGQSERGPGWRRWQVTITPTPDGFRLREEVSERGGDWKEAATLDYLRLADK